MVMLFTHPDDPVAFDRRFVTEYLPAVRALPGLQGVEVLRVVDAPLGEAPYYLMAELHFVDGEALRTAATSQAGRAAREALRFAPGLATTMYTD
jgi:uncharacterized protein (TIGR02118 family)